MSCRAATPLHNCTRMVLTVLLLLPMMLATRPIGLQPRSSVLRRMPMFFGKRASPALTSLPPSPASQSSSWRQPKVRPLSPPPLPPSHPPPGWKTLSRLVNEVDRTSELSHAGVSGPEVRSRSAGLQWDDPWVSPARKLSPEFYRQLNRFILDQRPSVEAAHHRPHDAAREEARPGTLSEESQQRPHSGPSGDEPGGKGHADDTQNPKQPEGRQKQLENAAESRRLLTRLEALARALSLSSFGTRHVPSLPADHPSLTGAGVMRTKAPLSLFLHRIAQDNGSKPVSRHFDVLFGDARDRTRQGMDTPFTRDGYLRPTPLTI